MNILNVLTCNDLVNYIGLQCSHCRWFQFALKHIIPHLSSSTDWWGFSSNEHIRYSMVQRYPDLPWKWNSLYYSLYDIESVLNNDTPLNWYCISRNKYLTLDIVEKYIDKPWDYRALSSRGDVSKFIEMHYDKPWDWDYVFLTAEITPFIFQKAVSNRKLGFLLHNNHMTETILETIMDELVNDGYILISSSEISMAFIEKHIDKPWSGLSSRKELTLDIIEKYPQIHWFWDDISENMNINTDVFRTHPNALWNWDKLSINDSPYLLELVDKYPDKPWNWNNISHHHTGMTMNFVEKHLDKPWNWTALTGHKNIPFSFIQKHCHKNLYNMWKPMSCGSNLTTELIQTYPNEAWDWSEIAFNPMRESFHTHLKKQNKNK